MRRAGAGAPVRTGIGTRALLVIGSVLLTLAVLELGLFRLLLPRLPLKHHVYLDEGIRILAQSSKAGAVPRDYVALAGDSYAQGRGDWLLAANANRNPAFHSAHVLRRRSGRDVVSFARGGAGSVRGILLDPLARLRFLEASRRFAVAPPRDLIVYFYEGNDLHDTLIELLAGFASATGWPATKDRPPTLRDLGWAQRGDLDDYFARVLDDPGLRDPARFEAVVGRALAAHPLVARAETLGLFEEAYFLRFVGALLRGEIHRWRTGKPPGGTDVLWPLSPPRPLIRDPNVLRVGGERVVVDGELQGPAPELSEAETDAALLGLEESLRLLGEALPATRICVVYVPSPAASYAYARDPVVLQPLGSRRYEWPARVVAARHEALRARVAEIARRRARRFVDASPDVREATRRRVLHGPRDWRHFNREGYEILGRAAARCLEP